MEVFTWCTLIGILLTKEAHRMRGIVGVPTNTSLECVLCRLEDEIVNLFFFDMRLLKSCLLWFDQSYLAFNECCIIGRFHYFLGQKPMGVLIKEDKVCGEWFLGWY
eukprot:TRINITY_DN45414_c0_g1_i1.p1 TRINITY_DN45414_c0_g1~~TRINITY_DN45414_c0_g1_i1.p1  ORF type:complete len:106 (-),score=13.38 TRINITY_DN45414_c0_g1_i1:223-540(-)